MPDIPREQQTLTKAEVNRLLSQRITQERRRYEEQLSRERSARGAAEERLRQQQERQRQSDMRQRAESALDSRHLPRALLPALRLDSEESLRDSLTAAENAFRAALESGVRERLRGAPPTAPLTQGKPTAPGKLSYQEAARLYRQDPEAFRREYGRE